MTLTHVTVVIRTNVPPESIQKEFLSKMTSFISNLFGAETGNVVVELHTNVQMMRAGSTSPMINMNVHHNSDKVETAKVELAGSIAQFLSREISMPVDSNVSNKSMCYKVVNCKLAKRNWDDYLYNFFNIYG